MSFTLWFTGLPASGKTTLARLVYEKLRDNAYQVELLDSDSFVPYLGYFFNGTSLGRDLNTRVMAIVASFLNTHNIVCLAAATTPRAKIREENRKLITNYIEVYCKCSLNVAEKRDPKGLYTLAKKGLIPNFTGVDEIYETPASQEIIVSTDTQSEQESVETILTYLTSVHHVTFYQDVSKEEKHA